MSTTLGYRDCFDGEFYSCHLGIAKPAMGFFRAILDALNLWPQEVLFIDDNEQNVEAARLVGLHAVRFCIDSGVDSLLAALSRFGALDIQR